MGLLASPALKFPGGKSLWSYNPLPGGCVLYLPLWSPGLNGPVFKTPDSFGHTVTVTGATLGPLGRTLDGLDDVLIVSDQDALDIGTSDFTLIQWVKLLAGAADAHQSLFDKRNVPSTFEGYTLYLLTNNNELRFQVNDADQFLDKIVATGVDVDDGTWRMYATSIDRDSATGGVASLNGAQIGADQDFRLSEKTIANGQGLNLGKDHLDTNNLKAIMGEAWIYNRVVSLTELLYIYNQTRWRYQ